MPSINDKFKKLEELLASYGRLAAAFSSGVDSAFLLKTAHDTLGDNAAAVTAVSPVFPERERAEAEEFCRRYGIRMLTVEPKLMELEAFKLNPPDRCFHCKRLLMSTIREAALKNGFDTVAEGSNLDDMGDYRPGLRALAELDIKSPLRDAGLTKADIRELSRQMGLPTWDKPSFACLASRFEYGNPITGGLLNAVAEAEDILFKAGFRQFRVRVHGRLARIELLKEDIGSFAESDTAKRIAESLHRNGFMYITLDLDGFRSGSMNAQVSERSSK